MATHRARVLTKLQKSKPGTLVVFESAQLSASGPERGRTQRSVSAAVHHFRRSAAKRGFDVFVTSETDGNTVTSYAWLAPESKPAPVKTPESKSKRRDHSAKYATFLENARRLIAGELERRGSVYTVNTRAFATPEQRRHLQVSQGYAAQQANVLARREGLPVKFVSRTGSKTVRVDVRLTDV